MSLLSGPAGGLALETKRRSTLGEEEEEEGVVEAVGVFLLARLLASPTEQENGAPPSEEVAIFPAVKMAGGVLRASVGPQAVRRTALVL